MRNEVLFTIHIGENVYDIAVDSNILIGDLIGIMTKKYAGKALSARLYSQNHMRILRSEMSLFDERIWDGDVLKLVK